MPLAPSRSVLIPLIIACALVMQELDSSVITTAIPAIGRSLQVDPLHLNLAITSYMLSLAVFIPLSGWLADRFGARTVFQIAMLVFTLGSICCGMARSLPELVGARILQGMGGAMMVPVGRLIILKAVSKAELVRAMIWFTTPSLIGPILGPPVGGFIVTYLSWPWIFFINIPIGLAGITLAGIFIHDSREPEVAPLDIRGFLQMGLALVGLVFGFEALSQDILSHQVIAVLVIGGALFLALYVRHTRHTEYPIVDLQLLKVATFRAATVGGALFRISAGALPFLFPLMLQLGFGLTPIVSGLLTFSGAAGALIMRLGATPIIRLFGFRTLLIGNALISGGFLFIYALFSPATPQLLILTALFTGGFFRSLQFTSLNTVAFADVATPLLSRASTLASTAQQLSFSLGVGLGAMLLNLSLVWHGTTTLGPQDFWPAFVCVGILTMASALFFLPLPASAGAEVSGKLPRKPVTD